MATNKDTDYLKYEANSMLEFLKTKVAENGNFTDQIYNGSNLSIILETLAALFEVQTYNLNFQATEGTFNGVQIYENMLKIVNMLGYKARATVPSTISGTLTANLYLDKLLPNLTTTTKNVGELVSEIQTALVQATNPKIISKNLSFSDPLNSTTFTILDNAQVYPEFTNLTPDSIFYWTNQGYTNESDMILSYLRYIWDLPDITHSTTLNDMMDMTGIEDKQTLIETYPTLPAGQKYVRCNLRFSSSDIDNFTVSVNGRWNSYFVTTKTTGERNETFALSDLDVSSLKISDGTLYAITFDPSTIAEQGVEIYKCVSSLKNYTSADRVFEYYVEVDKSIALRFGDGVYGKTLPTDQALILYFVVNDGKNGEIAQSAFNEGKANLSVGQVLQRNQNQTSVNTDLLNRLFLYDNIDVDALSKEDCNYIAKLLSTANSDNEYPLKFDVFFNPIASASNFQDIETVDYIRSIAPQYNRTSDRVITKGDLEIILKKDFIQYIYDTNIMNNFEYMSKFYKWLYTYDSLSKDVASSGYKFADSCNFNDIYIWTKSYTNYPVNDFIKKTIEKNLRSKKILTSEFVFLDSIFTYFYPYVGNLDADIDWLLYARDKYKFLIKSENSTDPYYKKYKTIDDLFIKKNGVVSRQATKKLINYILSGESTELKIEVAAYRDPNLNENTSTIKSNITNLVNTKFALENNRLGQPIELNTLNAEVGKITGLRKIQTNKYRNVKLYTNTGPVIDSVFSYVSPPGMTSTESVVNFDTNIDYPDSPTNASLRFNLDLTNLIDAGFTQSFSDEDPENNQFKIQWHIMQMSTGEEYDLDLEQDDSGKYILFLKSATASSSGPDGASNSNSIIQIGPNASRTNEESAYSIYAECWRIYEDERLSSYSNKIKFAVTAIDEEGKPKVYRLTSYVDDFAESTIELKDTISSIYDVVSDEPQWELAAYSYSLSFAKFTNSLIDAKDFDVVGAAYVTLEDFCFPMLYRDITSLIEVSDETSVTLGVNF